MIHVITLFELPQGALCDREMLQSNVHSLNTAGMMAQCRMSLPVTFVVPYQRPPPQSRVALILRTVVGWLVVGWLV